MNVIPDGPEARNNDDYLTSRRQAWLAFAMTFALMFFDFIVTRGLGVHACRGVGQSSARNGPLRSVRECPLTRSARLLMTASRRFVD